MLYSLAKREMLLATNESLVGTQQKKLQVTADDFRRTKTRNDQLVKVWCTFISSCKMAHWPAGLPASRPTNQTDRPTDWPSTKQLTGQTYSWMKKHTKEGSLLRRGSKGFFSGGVNPLSNVSAGTELQATAESAGASARYHTQDDRHPRETIFCALLPGVACTPCVAVKMADKISRFSNV